MKTVQNLKPRVAPLSVGDAIINIDNLRLRTYIGFNPEERSKRQDVVVNAEIHYDAHDAIRSDKPDDALNYKLITKRMIRHIEDGRFDLLEKLTADLLAIATESERVSHARVRVDKPHALRFADSVSVTLCANRGEAGDDGPDQRGPLTHAAGGRP